ncbi:hypothetical protein GGI21_005356, partial [Coemansia aciculifera]
WYDEESTTVANSKDTSGYSSRNISPDGAKRQSLRPKHRIETQPLRDREAERELRKQAQASRKASDPRPAPTPIPTPAPTVEATAVAAASDVGKPPVDHMAEARRALLGHYNVPNPELPVGRSIPRSGSATTTSFVRTSSVKVIQPPSFARPKQRPAVSNPPNIRPLPERKPAEQKPQSEPAASAIIDSALPDFSIPAFDVSKRAALDDGDGDDVPLSALARSRSEPMSTLPRRPTDDYLTRRFFGRNQPDVAGNPISRSNTQLSTPAPKVEEHVAKFEQMRSMSMDVAPRQSAERRRFGRWGNFF